MNIAIENALTLLPDGVRTATVYIAGNTICGIDDMPAGFKADKVIPGSGKFLIPGLVNAHSHAYMTVFRNCADDRSFDDWLFGKIMPIEDRLTGEDCYWASKLACVEMMQTGTTSYFDMGMFMEEAAQAAVETGIRAVLSRGLSGSPDDGNGSNPRLGQAISLYNNWKDRDNLSFAIGPHAPYSCDEAYMLEAAEEAEKYGLPVSIHLSESKNEVENAINQYGCTPIAMADRCGLLTDKTFAAHCVYATDEDIALMAERGVSVVTNPISNLKLANGVAPIGKFVKAGINVCLGTDGASSNNALNMFRDLGVLTLVHKGIEHDPMAVTAREGIKMATVNGARAMCLENVGEIKTGYKADLVLIDLDRPNMRPVNDPVAALCYSATGFETDTVIVNGRVTVEKGDMTDVDVAEIYAKVEKICERLGTR